MLDRPPADAAHTGLLRRIVARNSAALGELYDQLGGPIYSIALHILGDPREAEEVVQDVFLQVWNKAESFDAVLGSPFHWMIGIARNRCIDYLRSRQRRSRLLENATAEFGAAPAGAASPPAADSLPLRSDELAAVRAAVDRLPPDQHRAIAMAFFAGLSHPEIAAALGEPLGTVKARIRRGMMKLRDCLQPYV